MMLNKIEELLANINKSLRKNDSVDVEFLISDMPDIVNNVDFHRCEIFYKEVINTQFSLSSFRGAFMEHNLFVNCEFLNCSFVVAVINNTQFINCKFINCVFRDTYMNGNEMYDCVFENCYIDNNLISLNKLTN